MQEKENMKLHECENPWRPARFTSYTNMTEDEVETVKLYKKVQGILNRLTPQKFKTLLDQVRSLSIDTLERLQGIVGLVFEKAVDESNFSSIYALLCRELALIEVPVSDGKKKEDHGFISFRKLLLTRCQLEFDKNSVDETDRNQRIKEYMLDEYDHRLRMKYVGNIKFIGELYKQQVLVTKTMLRCLNNLLDTKDEESLECFCILLTTVSKQLEVKKVDLSAIFSVLNEIVEKKHQQIGNRVRFMVQDVIDLWMPQKQHLNPRLIEQWGISDGGVNASAIIKHNSNYDDWSADPSHGSLAQSDKLKNKAPMMDEPLSSIQMSGNWERDSNIKTQSPLIDTALENDKRLALGLRLNNKDSYSVKGPSFDCTYRQLFEEGRGYRSRPQHRSRGSSRASQRNPTPAPLELTPDQFEHQLKYILEEFLNHCCTLQECNKNINSSIPPAALPQLVSDGYFYVLKRSKTARMLTGYLFSRLIKLGTLSLQDYCVGLEAVLEEVDELITEIPRVWDYVAELVFSIICAASSARENFQKVFELLITKKYSSQLHVSLLMLIIEEKGVTFGLADCSPVINSVPSLVDSENLNQSNTLEEYLNGHCTLQKCEHFIKDSISPSALSELVSDWHMSVLEKSKTDRMQTGFLFAQLIKGGTLSLQSYCIGLTTIIEEASEMIFDIPSVWDDVAELVYPVMCEIAITPKDLHLVLDLFVKKHAIKVIICLFKMLVQASPNR